MSEMAGAWNVHLPVDCLSSSGLFLYNFTHFRWDCCNFLQLHLFYTLAFLISRYPPANSLTVGVLTTWTTWTPNISQTLLLPILEPQAHNSHFRCLLFVCFSINLRKLTVSPSHGGSDIKFICCYFSSLQTMHLCLCRWTKCLTSLTPFCNIKRFLFLNFRFL